MILADASVWIDYFGGGATRQVKALKGLIGDHRLALADLTLTEVLQGIRDQRQYEQTLFRLTALPLIIIGSQAVAIAAAGNYRFLRARGITIRKTIDTLIATRCIANGHALLYSDREFDPFVEHLGLVSAMVD